MNSGTKGTPRELMVSVRLRQHAYWWVVPGDGGLAVLPYTPGGKTR